MDHKLVESVTRKFENSTNLLTECSTQDFMLILLSSTQEQLTIIDNRLVLLCLSDNFKYLTKFMVILIHT